VNAVAAKSKAAPSTYRTQERPAARPHAAVANGATRAAILVAALECFAQDGFDGTSLSRIAQMAGVQHPLIHYYFGSKAKLWEETVDQSLGGLMKEAEQLAATSLDLAPLDRLRMFIRALTLFAARYPSHLALMMTEARSGSGRLAWIQENYTDPIHSHLRDILKSARKLGQIRDVSHEHLTPIIIGSVVIYFTTRNHSDQQIDLHVKCVQDVILNGICT
jgi:AcrR family transcriptional regulator